MRFLLRLWASLVSAGAGASGAQTQGAVMQRVRAELAALLETEAAKLPVDQPVVELGANELDVVEWTMAVEEAFQIQLDDEKIQDPKTKQTRKDFSIAAMAALVMAAPKRPAGVTAAAAEAVPKAIALKTLEGAQLGYMLVAVQPQAPHAFGGDCVFMVLPQEPALLQSELGALIAALKEGGEHPCRVVIAAGKVEISVTPATLPELRVVLGPAEGAGTLSVVKAGAAQRLGLAQRATT